MATTDKLAEFVVGLTYEQIPASAVALVKRQCLDTLGVGLAGWCEPSAPVMHGYIQSMAGKAECTVFGTKTKTSAADAALANGTLCHALDFDDVWLPTAHPTGCTFPALLAVAEAKRASGKALITAQMAAYEVLGKVHSAINGGAGWHGTAVFGTFGAAAGCGKLLGADENALRNAWGITASSTGGIAGQLGTMTKPLHAGNSARNGVMAATLATAGFTGNDHVFDAQRGFFHSFYQSVGHDLSRVTVQLANPFHILSPGVGVKMYPSGYYMHHPFEAALSIVQKEGIEARAVAEVEIGIPRAGYFDRPVIRVGLEGKFSQQYHAALAILDQKAEIESYSDQRALAPDMQELLKKIKVRVDASIPAAQDLVYNPVTIRLTDGRKFTAQQDLPKSHWRYPLKREEWLGKFKSNALRVLPERKVERVIQLVDRLEELTDVRELTSELVPD